MISCIYLHFPYLDKGDFFISQEYITFTIGQKKNIALIAHDNEKQKLIAWCKEHKTELEKHNLYGTGTTARMITDQTGLTVKGYNSGPLGGDQQIGAKIVEGVIDFVIFFSDPLTAQPHDPDVKALMRISQVYDIPVFCQVLFPEKSVGIPFFQQGIFPAFSGHYASLRMRACSIR